MKKEQHTTPDPRQLKYAVTDPTSQIKSWESVYDLLVELGMRPENSLHRARPGDYECEGFNEVANFIGNLAKA